MTSKEHVYDVIVIGGGVAGLSAAQELLRHGCGNICVVEAQNRLGGRVKQVTGLVPWALDAGAELVHGEDSTIASLLSQDLKADLLKKEYPNYVYWQDTGEVAACGDDAVEPNSDIEGTFDLIEQVYIPICILWLDFSCYHASWRSEVAVLAGPEAIGSLGQSDSYCHTTKSRANTACSKSR